MSDWMGLGRYIRLGKEIECVEDLEVHSGEEANQSRAL